MTAPNPGDYKLKSGRWTIDKDPREDEWYGLRIYGDIAKMGTAIANVTATVAGVVISAPAEIIDAAGYVRVKLRGLDVSPAADDNPDLNRCSYTITCANGESFPRTIYFKNKAK